jgi:hypothetical protein
MYRNCIFCSAALGSNDAVERFPVGRTLAFDGAKGRLWAVCRRCARWNLAPLEERWEAIEDAERLFRDTRLRVQSEHIGAAKLRDGTRLIRIGAALAGEVALMRYGTSLERRRWRYLSAGVFVLGGAAATMGLRMTGISISGVGLAGVAAQITMNYALRLGRQPPVHTFRSEALHRGEDLLATARGVRSGRLARDSDGSLAVWLPEMDVDENDWVKVPRFATVSGLVTGSDALAILRRGMVVINARGASGGQVRGGVERLARAGAEAYLHGVAERGEPLLDRSVSLGERRIRSLALEMALHEDSERRAMEGELSALEAMWREAEQIAAIADALPDIPAPDPPRLGA